MFWHVVYIIRFLYKDLKYVDYDNYGSIVEKTHDYQAPKDPILHGNSNVSTYLYEKAKTFTRVKNVDNQALLAIVI